MPRAPFDKTVSVYTGPDSPVPGVFRFFLTARFVVLHHLISQQPNETEAYAYITYSGPSLSTGDVVSFGQDVTVSYGTADVVEYPVASGTFYTVLRTEIISPLRSGLLPYRRVWLSQSV